MKKYLLIIKNVISRNLIYRGNSVIMMFAIFFSFVVLFYFWNSIYRQGNQIGTYSLNQIISYYIWVTAFEIIILDNTSWSVGEEIKNGQINNNILKPMSFISFKFSQSVGGLIFRLMMYLPVVLMVMFLFRNYLVFPNQFIVWTSFFCSVLFGFLLYFSIYFLVGIISFWTVDAFGFFFAAFVIVNFMQGGMIPLDLLPKWFLTLSNFLPFKYLFFIPVGIITQRIDVDWMLFFVPALWILVMHLTTNVLFKKGLKKYEGYGI